MKKNFLTIILVSLAILLVSLAQEETKKPRKRIKLFANDTLHIVTKPGYIYDLKVIEDPKFKMQNKKPTPVFTSSGQFLIDSDLITENGVLISVDDKNPAAIPPTEVFALKDTNEIHVNYGLEMVVIPCIPGAMVSIPCPSAPGGMLYIKCTQSIIEVDCTDDESAEEDSL